LCWFAWSLLAFDAAVTAHDVYRRDWRNALVMLGACLTAAISVVVARSALRIFQGQESLLREALGEFQRTERLSLATAQPKKDELIQ